MSKMIRLSSGVSVPYVEQGDANGIPVLLLHGFGGSWRSFAALLAYLSPSIHAFAFTQRGHGQASKPATGYRLSDFAADAVAFLDALGIEAAVIAGHSMGSAIARRAAIDYPNRMRGLVLIGAAVDAPGDPTVRAFWDTTVSSLSDPIDPALVQRFVDSTMGRPLPPSEVESMAQHMLQVPARVWRELWQDRLRGEIAGQLNRVTVPTLVVWGDQDNRASREDQSTLASAVAGARLVVYPGVGHAVHREAPEHLATDIESLVKAL